MLLKCLSTSSLSRRPLPRNIVLAVMGLLMAGQSAQSLAADSKAQRYANETAFRFTAGNGESTDAFRGFFLVPENRQRAGSRLLKLH